MKGVNRLDRVNELLKRELGMAIDKEWEGTGLISITKVLISPDLHQCTVYVSLFGTTKASEAQKALDFLKKNRSKFQASLAKNVILKFTPILTFVQDKTMERADRVVGIIENLESPHGDDAQ